MRFEPNSTALDAAIRSGNNKLVGDILYEAYGDGVLPSLNSALAAVVVNTEQRRRDLFDPLTLAVWLNWHVCAGYAWTGHLLFEAARQHQRPHQYQDVRKLDLVFVREVRVYVNPNAKQMSELRVWYEQNDAKPFMPWSADALACAVVNCRTLMDEYADDYPSRVRNRLDNRLKNLWAQLQRTIYEPGVREHLMSFEAGNWYHPDFVETEK
jgi:hypothetical protein